MTHDLEGRIAIVTGANHGIGAATARVLAARGAAVLVTSWRLDDPPDPGTPDTYREARAASGEAVVEDIAASGGRAFAAEADLTLPSTASELFDLAEAELGVVEILVNNASGWLADTFQEVGTDRLGRGLRRVDAATVDRVFGVDARGSALMISEFARRHALHDRTWGRIVGLTSGGPHGFPEEVSYGAAKAALENYTMSAAFELADRGITANVVHPPVTDTGWVTDEVRASVEAHPGLLSVAEPEDVAAVIAWLMTDDARHVTGNVLHMR